MLVYVNVPNIDDRVLDQAAAMLASGGLVAWPSDSSWCISCGLRSKKGLDSLKKLKGDAAFTPTVACSEVRQFEELVVFDNAHFRAVKSRVPGPFVFVLEARHSIHRHMAMKRSEIGLRIPAHPVPQALIARVGEPLFVITASRRMGEGGWWSQDFGEEHLFEYGAELEDIPGLDLIIDSGEVLPRQLATVVSLLGSGAEILRQGIGEY